MLSRKRFITRAQQLPSYKHLAAQHLFKNNMSETMNHILDTEGDKLSIDKLKQDALLWGPVLSNELGRLSQDIRDITGNNVLYFISYNEVPKNKKVAYANMVCDHRLLKTEKYIVILTIYGNILDYTDNTSSPDASLVEEKLLPNSVISDGVKGAKFMCLDMKAFPSRVRCRVPQNSR